MKETDMDDTGDFGERTIVVIGSSAGGIEALSKLFSTMPHDTSASFFVAQHLSPHSTSELDRILQNLHGCTWHLLKMVSFSCQTPSM
jgi:two-component system CheB/CheR fusion protein